MVKDGTIGESPKAGRERKMPPPAPVEEALDVYPPSPRSGRRITITLGSVIPSTKGDALFVVQAGTADTVRQTFESGVVVWNFPEYIVTGRREWRIGFLPPGDYEVRWLTVLPQQNGSMLIGARKTFTVKR